MEVTAPTLNGIHQKKQNAFDAILAKVKQSMVASLLTAGSVFAVLFGAFSFVYDTKDAIEQIPQIKSDAKEYQKTNEADKKLFIEALYRIESKVDEGNNNTKLVNQKVDDMKTYGFGRYHRETQDLIQKHK